MKRSSSLWMAVLTLTAVVLGVVYLAAPQPQARAEMLNAQSNFSLMTSGTPGGDEALIVIDKSQGAMAIYHLAGNNLEPLAGYSLAGGR